LGTDRLGSIYSYLFRPVVDNPYLKTDDEDEVIIDEEGSIQMQDMSQRE
jgi:hypothetical protein